MLNEIRKDHAGLRVVFALALVTVIACLFTGCATVAKIGAVLEATGGVMEKIGEVVSDGAVGDITHGTDAVGITSTAPVSEPAK